MTPKAEKEYWEDPSIISKNKEDGHATLIPYDSNEEAISGKDNRPTTIDR